MTFFSPLRGCFLLTFCVVPLFAQADGAKVRPPNIVFLLADDLGYGDLGCFGSPVIKTPHLDRLAAQGVKLQQCYAASPNCSPARTGILTGRSPYRVGMYDYIRFAALHIPKTERTIPALLRQAGYQTMFAGKWHCSGRFRDGTQPGPGDHGFEHWFANARNFGRNPKGFVRNGKALPVQSGWMAEIVVDETIAWLQQRDSKRPFCTFLWFSEPHTPVVAAEEFKEKYQNPASDRAARSLRFGGEQVVRRRAQWDQRHRYFGCVSMLDHHIGRLLAKLDALGLRDNTIVVFTSDNGPEHRTPTAFGSPGPSRGAKGHMHDGGIHVPGIVRWPGRIKAGSVCAAPVNGTDYLPTLCKVAGAPIPQDRPIDGADVMPALTATGKVDRKTAMLWWLWHARGKKQVAMRDGDYKLLAHMTPQAGPIGNGDARPPKGWSPMRFIKESRLAGFALYDLKADPGESRDLRTVDPKRFERLRAKMEKLHREIQAEGPTLELGRGKGARRRRG
ncbi:MAG: arylsulfatase [Planctomycetes bacterium]|nr:arylsulfatase [Planctomycetota bacterium]